MLLAAIAPAVDSNVFNTSMEFDTNTHAWHQGIFRGDMRGRRNTWGVCLPAYGSPASIRAVAEMISGLRGAYEELAHAYAPNATRAGESAQYYRKMLPPGAMALSLLAHDPETDSCAVWCIDEWYDLPEMPKMDIWKPAGVCDGWTICYNLKNAFLNFESEIPNLIHMTLLQLCSWDCPPYAELAACTQTPSYCQRAVD